MQHPRNYKAIFPFNLQIGQFRIKGSTIQRFYTANMMSTSLMSVCLSVCPLYITTPCDFSLYLSVRLVQEILHTVGLLLDIKIEDFKKRIRTTVFKF